MTSPARSPISVSQSLRRIWPYSKREFPLLVAGMVVALLASALALAIPITLEYLVDGPLATGDTQQIWLATGIVAVLGLLEAFFIYLRRVLVVAPGTVIDARLRNDVYQHVQGLPVAFHDQWQSGQLLSRAQNDVSLVRRWLSFGLILLVANTLTILLGMSILFSWSPLLALVFFLCALPMAILGSHFRQRFQVVSRRAQDQWGDVATLVEESIHGIRVIKSFGRSDEFFETFSAEAEEARRLEVEKGRMTATLGFWLSWIPDAALALCLFFGVWLAQTGELTTGQLFAFFTTAAVLVAPISSFSFLIALTIDAKNGIDRIFEVMDEQPTIVSPDSPVRPVAGAGRLRFDDVHFRYASSPPDVPDLLRGLSLSVEPGETLAVVGETGSGKTTLTALPARLLDVSAGRIELDGVDVRDFELSDLRRRVGMAFEEATLFSASVRDNVLLGIDHTTSDEEELEQALHEAIDIAQATFVYDLPRGVDTVIGEQGLSLSGGQRQRLALARAIASQPEVLVLDDPLSALDVETEALVEQALRRVLANTTALIIAQRPSTVMLADRVALLSDGVIVATGTHQQLLHTSEEYRHLMSSPDQANPATPAGAAT